MSEQDQPEWVCFTCGVTYGANIQERVSSYHEAQCGVCRNLADVTQAAEFGWMRPEWKSHYA